MTGIPPVGSVMPWRSAPARRANRLFNSSAGLLPPPAWDEPQIIAIDSLTAQKRLVEANFGIALLAESGVTDELKRGSLWKLRVPALRTSIPVLVVHRQGGYLSQAARTFLSVLLQRPPSLMEYRRHKP